MKTGIVGLVIATLSLAGCGGGGSSGGGGSDVTGLEIAEQMSLVTASESGSALLKLMKFAVPTAGDFITDTPEIYVFDESMEVLDLINEILCSIDQTRYAEMVNQGNYLALIDTALCGRREDHASEESDRSSAENQDFEEWIVNSSREDNDSPQIVRFWVPGDGMEEGFDEIRCQITITEGKSAENPFGIFSADFAGYLSGVQTMTGNLSSVQNDDGNIEFEMFIDGGSFFQEETHAILSPDGTSGQAYALRFESFFGETFDYTVNVAFNETHYLSDFGDRTQCLDRLNFRNNVWEYNLYAADGSRVSRNSGIPIRVGEEHGWAGYYGIWLPDEISLENGMTVTGEEGGADYTVFVGAGRLMKRTRQELTLEDFIGVPVNMWDPETGQSNIVEWNGTNLVKTGLSVCNEEGCTVTDTADTVIDPEPFQWFGAWWEGAGNLDFIADENGNLSNATPVPLFVESFVTPDDELFADGAVTLKCYYQCPKPNLTQGDVDAGNLFNPDVNDPEGEPYLYTFDPETYALSLDGQAVSLEGLDLTNSPNFWGIHTGAMVLQSVTVNPWEVWGQEVSYTYETGPNPWNRYSALLDEAGSALTFEAPLSCFYDGDEGVYRLEYGGEGQLWGIPFEKIESEESDFEHWIAAFTIPDGTEIECGGTPYYTKAMVIEQNMQAADQSECVDLTIESVGPPTNEFTDPEMEAAPTVTDPPAVIGGILQ
jgi:hypothetical protein